MPTMFKWLGCDCARFEDPADRGTLALAEGNRFVVMMEGQPPSVMAIDQPGSYHLDVPADRPDVTWPVVIVSLPAEVAYRMVREKVTIARLPQPATGARH